MEIRTKFGEIIINGEKFHEDVIMDWNNKIFKRPKHLSAHKKKLYGHTPFTKDELLDIIKNIGKPDILVIGTGQYGALPIEEEVYLEARKLGITLLRDRTPNAIEIYLSQIKSNRKVIALFHITC